MYIYIYTLTPYYALNPSHLIDHKYDFNSEFHHINKMLPSKVHSPRCCSHTLGKFQGHSEATTPRNLRIFPSKKGGQEI